MFERGTSGGCPSAAPAPRPARRARPQRRRAERRGDRPVGDGEGALNLVAWAGLRRGGPAASRSRRYDWVTPFETATGCKVTVKVGGDSSDDGPADEDRRSTTASPRPATRRLRLIAGGDVAAGQHRPDPELQGRLRGPQEPALQHGRRRGLRRPARPRREPPDVQHRRRDHRARQLERRCSTATRRTRARSPPTTTRSTSPTRRSYLMTTKPELGITNPYALDDTSSRRPSTCSRQQQRPSSASTGALPRSRSTGSPAATWSIGTDLAVPGEHCSRRGQGRAGRGVKPKEGRDGLVRHLDDLVEGQASELHVQVDGLHHLARGQRAGRPSGSARRRSARRPAPRPRS